MAETERLWIRLWCSAPGIGWHRLQALRRAFPCLAEAWAADAGVLRVKLAQPTRMGERAFQQLLRFREAVGPAPLDQPASPSQRQRWRGRRVLVCGDAALPETVLELDRPPLQLFWKGQGSLWASLRQRRAVAVVGTRRPSRHGETMARAIGRTLAEAGWPVVSGLAEGIDAAAHRGCLEAGGRPVGVLGTPLERVYPRHHATLQAEVARRGLLVSELAEGTPVRAGHFAQRNRLQVALSCAVVLVECPHSSGALHSALLAWEQGTPLWVVPADAARISAAGSNRWLGQGATPLLDPADLVRSLGTGPLLEQRQESLDLADSDGSPLRKREAALLAALGPGASLEQLCERLRSEPSRLSERLLNLELAGLVRSEQGLWWRPCRRADFLGLSHGCDAPLPIH
jgi:DNA processing protein